MTPTIKSMIDFCLLALLCENNVLLVSAKVSIQSCTCHLLKSQSGLMPRGSSGLVHIQ